MAVPNPPETRWECTGKAGVIILTTFLFMIFSTYYTINISLKNIML